MIEIVIPYNAFAIVLGITMILTSIGICFAIALTKPEIAAFLLCFLLFVDGISALESSFYMQTPGAGQLAFKERCFNVSSLVAEKCIYPTHNPYEEQPIHPLLWIYEILKFPFDSVKITYGRGT